LTDNTRLTAAYGFNLPHHLIAQQPATPRDASRLMVLRHGEIEHRTFRDLPQYLRPGDVLVLNETRVIAARLFGTRQPSGGHVELLLLRPVHHGRYDPRATRWETLGKPARRLREGQRIEFDDLGVATVVGVQSDGIREVEFALNVPFEEFLARAGTLPLPPYIHNESAEAQERYQTIFAREPGSVAAPTASLHFTERVFDALHGRGVEIVKLVLDVGLGTFRPMQGETLDEHVMHSESFSIPQQTHDAIARAKAAGRRIVAAGTTVMRALEGSVEKHGSLKAGSDETDIFITPGFQFRIADALITNFHLPHSTLLVLVSAFAGRETILRAYAEAVRLQYRFFSFGDAMFIEP
jgi:S-adenosylmethionine:tRNA ribosyltransferase-isomerase